MLFMYDYVRTKLPLSFRNIFKLNCDVYDAYIARRAQMFHIPKTKSRFVDKLPLYNFPSMWNNWCTQLNVNSTRGALKNYENKAIRDGRPRPPRHQVGWDIPLHFDTNPESLRPFVPEIWPNNVFNLSATYDLDI